MKHLIIGTAGHVDHGKTALIKALTGIDCDTHKEEKERGITINLGFSHLTLPDGQSFGIVDVPGHKDFIKTMVAGAYGIDLVLLVVAADSGIMPQTAEHLKIIEMLGVKHGLIILNKSDLVDDEMLELAQLEIEEFLEGTCFEGAPIVPVSSITGKGLDHLIQKISELIPTIQEREKKEHFRMYIDRIFNVKGIGFVVTGSVLEGEIETGKEVFLLPGRNKKMKIRAIQKHGDPVEKVYCGDRAALNLTGIKGEDFERGMVLSDKLINETSMIDATFNLFATGIKLSLWSRVVFYTGTFECAARMHLLNKDTIQTGDDTMVQIHLSKPAILENKDKFIVRNSSNDLTLGGGTIIDVQPLHHKRRTGRLLEGLNELMEAALNSDKIIHLIKIELRKENAPVYAGVIAKKISKPEKEVVEACRQSSDHSIFMAEADGKTILLTRESHEQYQRKVTEELEQWHRKNPILEEGLELPEFYGKFGFANSEASKQYLEKLLEILHQNEQIKKVGTSWALVSHNVKIDMRTQEQLNWLEQTLSNYGMENPLDSEIEEKALANKIPKDRLKMMLKYLGRQKKVIFYEGDYLHYFIVDKCRNLLLNYLKDKPNGINEKEFRLLINGTKKIVQTLQGIFIEEGIISKRSFFIDITDKGKGLVNDNSRSAI
jgi:selenocysteine-specific elongation factor